MAEEEMPVDQAEEDMEDIGLLGDHKDEDVDLEDPDAIMEQDDEEDKFDDEDNESQAVRQIMKEEDINLVPESQDVSEIDKLTGIPTRKDMLMFAMPMLAPYSTI